MYLLRLSVKHFIISGSFRPTTITSPLQKFAYNTYAVIVAYIIHTTAISQTMDSFYNINNKDDFSETFCITITFIVICFKMDTLVLRRKDIVDLLDRLQKEPFLPVNPEEMEIHAKYKKLTEKLAAFLIIQVSICISSLIGASCISNFKEKTLTFRTWIPYDYTSSWFPFAVTFIHQALATFYVGAIVITFDTLLSALLLQTCCQFEVLHHRLTHIEGDGNVAVKQCAYHHKEIYNVARIVNDVFGLMLSIQFSGTLIGVGFYLYRLTEMKMDSQIIGWIMLIVCAFLEMIYMCWHGEQTTTKSSEVCDRVFGSNWPALSNSAKKDLILIMARSLIPVQITSISILTMNMELFKSLVKSSYAGYNLLRQSNSA